MRGIFSLSSSLVHIYGHYSEICVHLNNQQAGTDEELVLKSRNAQLSHYVGEFFSEAKDWFIGDHAGEVATFGLMFFPFLSQVR